MCKMTLTDGKDGIGKAYLVGFIAGGVSLVVILWLSIDFYRFRLARRLARQRKLELNTSHCQDRVGLPSWQTKSEAQHLNVEKPVKTASENKGNIFRFLSFLKVKKPQNTSVQLLEDESKKTSAYEGSRRRSSESLIRGGQFQHVHRKRELSAPSLGFKSGDSLKNSKRKSLPHLPLNNLRE